jgi:hypothetical protein
MNKVNLAIASGAIALNLVSGGAKAAEDLSNLKPETQSFIQKYTSNAEGPASNQASCVFGGLKAEFNNGYLQNGEFLTEETSLKIGQIARECSRKVGYSVPMPGLDI